MTFIVIVAVGLLVGEFFVRLHSKRQREREAEEPWPQFIRAALDEGVRKHKLEKGKTE